MKVSSALTATVYMTTNFLGIMLLLVKMNIKNKECLSVIGILFLITVTLCVNIGKATVLTS